MASDYVMYMSILAIGVLALIGTTSMFSGIDDNARKEASELSLSDIGIGVRDIITNLHEQGYSSSLTSNFTIRISIDLPREIQLKDFEVSVKHGITEESVGYWYIECILSNHHEKSYVYLNLPVTDSISFSGTLQSNTLNNFLDFTYDPSTGYEQFVFTNEY